MRSFQRVAPVLAALGLAACAGEPEPRFANGKTEIENKVAAQMAVEAQLRDPKSAEWGTIVVRDKGGQTFVCGMVNAKNGFGGYVGERPFLYGGNTAVLMTEENAKEFGEAFARACAA